MPIADKLQSLIEIKLTIKQALTNHGKKPSNEMADYAGLISELNNTTDATAEAKHILAPYTAYMNGMKYTGTMPTKDAAEYTPTTQDQAIEKDVYLKGNQVIKGDSALVNENIKAGATIFGVTGKQSVVDTNDATATDLTIHEGKTAYVNGEKITGTAVAIPKVVGRNDPSKNWTSITIGESLRTIAYGDDTVVIGGDSGAIVRSVKRLRENSTLEKTFSLVDTKLGFDIKKIVFGGGVFVAIGKSNIAYSLDQGATWHEVAGITGVIKDITYAGGPNGRKFVVVGNETRYWSDNGVKWNAHSTTRNIKEIVWGNDVYVYIADGEINKSDDLTLWKTAYMGDSTGTYPNRIFYSKLKRKFYIATLFGGIFSSADAATWTEERAKQVNNKFEITAFAENEKVLVAVDIGGNILCSTGDGTWNRIIAAGVKIYDVTWSGTHFVAVGPDKWYAISTDGINWEEKSYKEESFNCIKCFNGYLIAVKGAVKGLEGPGAVGWPDIATSAPAFYKQGYTWHSRNEDIVLDNSPEPKVLMDEGHSSPKMMPYEGSLQLKPIRDWHLKCGGDQEPLGNPALATYKNEIHVLGEQMHYKITGTGSQMNLENVGEMPFYMSEYKAAAEVAGKLYALDGEGKLWSYDGSSWTNESTMSFEISEASAAEHDGKLHVVATNYGEDYTEHWIYDTEAKTWSKESSWADIAGDASKDWNSGVRIISYNGHLLMFGGGRNLSGCYVYSNGTYVNKHLNRAALRCRPVKTTEGIFVIYSEDSYGPCEMRKMNLTESGTGVSLDEVEIIPIENEDLKVMTISFVGTPEGITSVATTTVPSGVTIRLISQIYSWEVAAYENVLW